MNKVGKQPNLPTHIGTKEGHNMTGLVIATRRVLSMGVVLAAAVALGACDESGQFALSGAGGTEARADRPSRSIQTQVEGRDVERPDIFEVNDRGLWDGRPSLGGVWVAHPDVQDPERVIIRNPANGRSVVGALFRRERENPGPLLQISSDAAEELDVLAGAPTALSVIALRREEVVVEEPAEPEVNPVVASLETPANVEATPLDPVAGAAAAAIDAAEDAGTAAVDTAADDAGAVAVVLPAAVPASEDAAAEADEASPVTEDAAVLLPSPDAAGEADLTGPQIQVGVFSVMENADATAQRLRNAGIPASVQVQQAGGRDVWQLIASPAEQDADADATIARINALGLLDAVQLDDGES